MIAEPVRRERDFPRAAYAPGERLQSLQVVRALAIMLVVLHHSVGWARFGGFGVDLFFVVSGFVIASTRPRSVGDFLTRRFLRIYPLYWLMSLPLLLMVSLEPGRVATSVTLWAFWGSTVSHPYLLVAWTLCFEVLFYCAAAIALWNWRVPLLVYGAAGMLAIVTDNQVAGFVGNPLILEFLAGMVLTRIVPIGRLGAIAMILALGVLCWVPHSQIADFRAFDPQLGALRLFAWGIPAMLMVYAALTAERMLTRFEPLTSLGDASYSIYLVFGPLTAIIAPFSAVAAITVSLLAGLAVHRTIEKPLLAALRRPGPLATPTVSQ
ncbi:MAG: acyltransferase family protein [Croceibacterium sp.]